VRARAYSPSHVTGFFEICDTTPDPLRKGSRGSGACLDLGAITEVEASKSNKLRAKVLINGYESNAVTSLAVIKRYHSLFGSFDVKVNHHLSAPIGFGFGASGSGALSLSLALKEALNLNLSYEEAAQIAHLAEIDCLTGLGTVIGETVGGIEIRLKPGAPGIGLVDYFIPSKDYYLVAFLLSPISTRSMLLNKSVRAVINGMSRRLIDELLREKNVENFLRLSRLFTSSLNFASREVKKILNEIELLGFIPSITLFGNVAYTIVKEDELNELNSLIKKFEVKYFVSKLARKGAHIID
jgi:pantoate kinase